MISLMVGKEQKEGPRQHLEKKKTARMSIGFKTNSHPHVSAICNNNNNNTTHSFCLSLCLS